MRRYVWGISNLLGGLLLLGIAYVLFFQRQELIDWWRLRQYQPSAAVATLAQNVQFTQHGQDLFYASLPVVQRGDMFNAHCSNDGEESLVLGCYRAQQIYLFDVTDPQLAGVKEVTAAHEMLHAAYERMDNEEKNRINELLTTQLGSIKNDRLNGLIKTYNDREPGQLLNEMHSIIGTEYRHVSPELETYYRKYFTNRHKVVTYAETYESVFTASKQRLADYDTQLADLTTAIKANNTQLERDKIVLEKQNNELDRLRGTDREAYNARVPQFNAQVAAFNQLANSTQSLISRYNQLVVARNGEAVAQNNLYRSLDSRQQEVKTNQ